MATTREFEDLFVRLADKWAITKPWNIRVKSPSRIYTGKRYCPRMHDTWECGRRSRTHLCVECSRMYDRNRWKKHADQTSH